MTMNSKVHKAKLISIHNRLIDRTQQNFCQNQNDGRSIHTYFALLRHIFQRNKLTIRKNKQNHFEQGPAASGKQSSRSVMLPFKVSQLEAVKNKSNWRAYQAANKSNVQTMVNRKVSKSDIAMKIFQNGKQIQNNNSSGVKQNEDELFIPIGKIARKIQISCSSQNPLISKAHNNFEVAIYPKHLSQRNKTRNRSYRTYSAELTHMTKNQKRKANAQLDQRYEQINIRGSHHKSQIALDTSINLRPSPWKHI